MSPSIEYNRHCGAVASCPESPDGGQGSGSRVQWTPRRIDVDLAPIHAALRLIVVVRLDRQDRSTVQLLTLRIARLGSMDCWTWLCKAIDYN